MRSPETYKLDYFWMELNFLSAHNIFQLLMCLQSTGALLSCCRIKLSKEQCGSQALSTSHLIVSALSSDHTTCLHAAFLKSMLGSKIFKYLSSQSIAVNYLRTSECAGIFWCKRLRNRGASISNVSAKLQAPPRCILCKQYMLCFELCFHLVLSTLTVIMREIRYNSCK